MECRMGIGLYDGVRKGIKNITIVQELEMDPDNCVDEIVTAMCRGEEKFHL